MDQDVYIKLVDKLNETVEYIIKSGTEETTMGNWIFDFSELQENISPEIKESLLNIIANRLCEREEVSDVEIYNGSLDVNYYLEYCSNYEDTMEQTM